jgi:hypothetical protein
MSLPVPVPYNPALSRMLDGQLYAISGGTWIPVPDGTTRADLPKYMTWHPPTVTGQAWKVEGSKGSTYTVREVNGAWSCSCPGYTYHRKCRHIAIKREAE